MGHPYSGKVRRAVWAAVITLGSMASVVSAEDAWIQGELVDLRQGKGAIYPRVAQLPKGTQVTVLGREGNWVKVQVADKQGYVLDTAISGQKVTGGGNLFAAMGAGVDASDTAAGAASRGLRPEAEAYAASRNLDPKLIDRLIELRKSITPEQWEAFCAAGKVGPNGR